MRILAALALMFSAGCGTAPLARLLDWVSPGGAAPGDRGGIDQRLPPVAIDPLAAPAAPSPTLPRIPVPSGGAPSAPALDPPALDPVPGTSRKNGPSPSAPVDSPSARLGIPQADSGAENR
jgi:hypothetical protein